MKRFITLVGAMAAVAVPLAAVSSSAAPTKNVVQVAASAPQFSTLVTLVKKAGLVSALSGPKKITVFAPTNAAFAKLESVWCSSSVCTLRKVPRNLHAAAGIIVG